MQVMTLVSCSAWEKELRDEGCWTMTAWTARASMMPALTLTLSTLSLSTFARSRLTFACSLLDFRRAQDANIGAGMLKCLSCEKPVALHRP
eukprot:2927095-Rhodomonas_salina.1